jgi:hypothetical protein
MRYGWLILGAVLIMPALLTAESRTLEKAVTYGKDVKPIVADKCLSCHRGEKAKGGFNMESLADINKGGRKTKKVIVAGKPDESQFYRVLTEEGKPHMPPRTSRKRTTEKEVETIKQWIADGAKE